MLHHQLHLRHIPGDTKPLLLTTAGTLHRAHTHEHRVNDTTDLDRPPHPHYSGRGPYMKPPTNPRRANGHRRNQTRDRVHARDTLCWLCKEPVDKTLPPRQPRSPEVHELIPVSRGGSPYDLNNCVLTHRACNQWIGNRTPDEVQRDNRDKPTITTTTLIDW